LFQRGKLAAALEYGFANGLQQVNWTCDAGNPGSVRTAEKLGLQRIEDYNMAVLIMDEQSHHTCLKENQPG
jgi:RimJ/RimL family protein N-acetyltransferase